MKSGRSRWLLRLAIVPVIGIAMLLWANQEKSHNVLTVENRSGQPLSLVKVGVAGQAKTYRDVAAEAVVTVPLWAGGDGETVITVECQLSSKSTMRWQGKPDAPVHLVVLPDGQIIIRPAGKG
jgi:hypothetical protein